MHCVDLGALLKEGVHVSTLDAVFYPSLYVYHTLTLTLVKQHTSSLTNHGF